MQNLLLRQLFDRYITNHSAYINYISNNILNDINHLAKKVAGCKGKVIVCGVGKSAIVAQKWSATLSAVGFPSLTLDSANALHGDIGVVAVTDLLIVISKSGASTDLGEIMQTSKQRGISISLITNSKTAPLLNLADNHIIIPIHSEIDHEDVLPTLSVMMHILIGDMIVMQARILRGFGAAEFAKNHSGGAIGLKLKGSVRDILSTNQSPKVAEDATFSEVIVAMTNGKQGAVAVIGGDLSIKGIITDGDVRRMLLLYTDLNQMILKEAMTVNPKCIDINVDLATAIDLMRSHKISQLIVTHEAKYYGMLHLQDLLALGL